MEEPARKKRRIQSDDRLEDKGDEARKRPPRPTSEQLSALTYLEVHNGKYPGGEQDSDTVRFQHIQTKYEAEKKVGKVTLSRELEDILLGIQLLERLDTDVGM